MCGACLRTFGSEEKKTFYRQCRVPTVTEGDPDSVVMEGDPDSVTRMSGVSLSRCLSQTNIGTVSKATLGQLQRDGVEGIWAFPSA